MKISLEWLQDFIDLTETDTQTIADRVTEGVAEVDEVEVQRALLGHCVVGSVLSVTKHPNADVLSLCEVKTDKGVKRVVCGGSNLRVSMRVAFAHAGARVRWHGTDMVTLEKVKIRGEESEGMICTAEELDLTAQFPASRERVLIDLGDGTDGVGKSLKEYLGLTDTVLHIDNHAITHRADLFSHVGFAREFVALGLATWKKKPAPKMPLFGKEPVPFKFVNEIPELVPRYSSCIIEMDGPGETPDWMKRRLEAVGWRSILLPIDITNYVATEIGMPLHAFDVDDLKGDVHIRLSQKGERITTLDGVDRPLPGGAIILEDKEGIFDLMGVMGGLRSSTKDTTRRIYLHSACVDPVSIRKTIIETGHRTDAATVYEKGIPRVIVQQGLFRALELLLKHVPGAHITSQLESWGDDGKPEPIILRPARVNQVLGTELADNDMQKILSDLAFDVENEKRKTSKRANESMDTSMLVIPPLHRLGDIRGEHDLIEEIGRVAGYNEIPAAMPMADTSPPPRDQRMNVLRDALEEERFIELLPLSITGKAALEKAGADASKAVRIQNPIGEELGVLHTSTLPALLEHAQRNLLHAGDVLRTFHGGHVFEQGREQPAERAELSLLVARIHGDADDIKHDPFLQLKQSVTHALDRAGYGLRVSPAMESPTYAHPGRSAALFVGDTNIGLLFEVHPIIRERFDLPHRAAAATIDISALLALAPSVTVARPVPEFPAITYDVTMPSVPDRSIGDLLETLRRGSDLLESINIVDLYAGKSLGDRRYNVTLRFVYRAPDRTLTEAEAQKIHAKLTGSLAQVE